MAGMEYLKKRFMLFGGHIFIPNHAPMLPPMRMSTSHEYSLR